METDLLLLIKFCQKWETLPSISVCLTTKKEWKSKLSYSELQRTTPNRTTLNCMTISTMHSITSSNKQGTSTCTISRLMENTKVIALSKIELLQSYLRDPHNLKLYSFNTGISYDSHADDVYNNLYTDFMIN